ncbi:hypothetical protein Ciccas_011141 [Cichlidogyrus casuarinus]|uniref:REJ domain-containing protein n=1 Tax=Cichlidogyrus casuarinus TaxID=1844966 RepID=A0ABD2PTR3_9PLAT
MVLPLTGLEVGNTYSVTIVIITNDLAGTLSTSNEITIASSFTPPPKTQFKVQIKAAVARPDGNDQVYTPNLANNSSPEFLAIANNLCSSLTIFITNAPGSYIVESCNVASLSPGSVIALVNMVLAQFRAINTREFDPSSTLSSGMANTPRSQVPLLLDSLNATSQVIQQVENNMPALRMQVPYILCMQLIVIYFF